jgi:hypothetical protein
VALTDQFAQRLVQRRQIPADAAHMPHFAVVTGLGGGDVNALLANFATTRPTTGPVPLV